MRSENRSAAGQAAHHGPKKPLALAASDTKNSAVMPTTYVSSASSSGGGVVVVTGSPPKNFISTAGVRKLWEAAPCVPTKAVLITVARVAARAQAMRSAAPERAIASSACAGYRVVLAWEGTATCRCA
eukprot:CAMPEP_0179090652 /NCGR_PEP_ID=MMETSP0796-20121207/41369_1 /TAXON_ID=73915 /ORGANISM="Pyrodinium bahamense, Strain pbaha01" /LENGTH=127 /DNA_ID=CAMNT_0020788227 /DNA_START=52 /DNA_END=435 /DNA_ORIENTATION=-